jgi:hypothetical protein
MARGVSPSGRVMELRGTEAAAGRLGTVSFGRRPPGGVIGESAPEMAWFVSPSGGVMGLSCHVELPRGE